jgi:hypothetical protein
MARVKFDQIELLFMDEVPVAIEGSADMTSLLGQRRPPPPRPPPPPPRDAPLPPPREAPLLALERDPPLLPLYPPPLPPYDEPRLDAPRELSAVVCRPES